MSEYALILKTIADDLAVVPAEQERIRLYTIIKVLNGLRDYYHKEATMAGLGITESDVVEAT